MLLLHSQRKKFARFITASTHLTPLVTIRTSQLCSLAARRSLRETGNVYSTLSTPSPESWRQRHGRIPSCAPLAPSPQPRPQLPGLALPRPARHPRPAPQPRLPGKEGKEGKWEGAGSAGSVPGDGWGEAGANRAVPQRPSL